MFVTRAGRRELADVEAFYDSEKFFDGWEKPDLTEGTVFIARQGPIIGALRLIEVAPQTLVIEDVLVAESHRGQGIGKQLIDAAFANRGGTAYLCCHEDRIAFYERSGFAEVPQEEMPEPVYAFFEKSDSLNTDDSGDHIHHFMKAR